MRIACVQGWCFLFLTLFCAVTPLRAQEPEGPIQRLIEFRFTPTKRAQIAIWLERADGTFLRTVRLTRAVSLLGIGNRPGATQMNSGFRWPYGRRESALPVWAYRRSQAEGIELFPRVIFQNRISEGHASRSSEDSTRDDYFCLSFDAARSHRDALDAVTCASAVAFNSDKGRYITAEDIAHGYAEPWQEHGGDARMRPLTASSMYPPRLDVTQCGGATGCVDHPDVNKFAVDARRLMPEIDAVAMATPAGDMPQLIRFTVPAEWPDGEYVAFLEIHVEGDYNNFFNEQTYPTPTQPNGGWDIWAETYGYSYRGQPSVVYRVPFTMSELGGTTTSTSQPAGYGSIDGPNGVFTTMDDSISMDPDGAPGSGGDRLRPQPNGTRLEIAVAAGRCDADIAPQAIETFSLAPVADKKNSHRWAHMRFVVPASDRPIGQYQVKVSRTALFDEDSFLRAKPANAASDESEELRVPVDNVTGSTVDIDFGFGELSPATHYWVGIRAIDTCNSGGPITFGDVTTTSIHFTTVTPCFVATAAYGSPMAEDVNVLRRFRDRFMMTTPGGRSAVSAYYKVGPTLASAIREHKGLRAIARFLLRPWVAFARILGA